MMKKDMRAMARRIASERQADVPASQRKTWWDPSWKAEIQKLAWERVAEGQGSARRGPHRLPITRAPPAVGQKRLRSECVICMDGEPTYAFSPCMHLCVCSSCHSRAETCLSECPVCRNPKQALTRIY